MTSTMNDQWDKRMMEFLRKTGEDIKSETQRLVSEVRDPAKQQKVRDALKDFGVWAKKTAEEAAEMVETAVKKAETAWKKPVDGGAPGGDEAPTEHHATSDDEDDKTPTEPLRVDEPPQVKRPAKKTVGRKSGGAAAKKSKPAPKTVGRKKG